MGTRLVVLKAPKKKNYHLKNSKPQYLPKITTQLLEIIHRPCCEKFHVGNTFFLVVKVVSVDSTAERK